MTVSKPTVLFIATRVPYPPVTGHYLRTFNIIVGLAERYRVHFFGFFEPQVTEKDAKASIEALTRICETVHTEYVRSERSRFWLLVDFARAALTGRPFVAVKYWSASMRRAFRRALEREAPLLVHGDSLPSGDYLLDARCPKLLTNHNVEYERMHRLAVEQTSWLMKLVLRWQASWTRRYELALIRAIRNCVVVSDADKTVLLSSLPEARFYVVPNGAHVTQAILPPPSRSKPVALWVGGMNDPYNRLSVVHFAKNILPIIIAKRPGFRWRVVGKSPPPELVALSREPQSPVELAGFVENIYDEYRGAQVVVAPLVAGAGTKLKVLEAMAAGRAVVTTPIGAEGLAVQDGVELAIATTPGEFAERVVELLDNPALCHEMAAAARALVERMYDWRVIAQAMADAVEDSVRNHRLAVRDTQCAA